MGGQGDGQEELSNRGGVSAESPTVERHVCALAARTIAERLAERSSNAHVEGTMLTWGRPFYTPRSHSGWKVCPHGSTATSSTRSSWHTAHSLAAPEELPDLDGAAGGGQRSKKRAACCGLS